MAARLNWQRIYVQVRNLPARRTRQSANGALRQQLTLPSCLPQNMAYRSGPDCGPDMWFAFEYFADGRECSIPAWNGPEYAREEADEKARERKGQHMGGGLDGGGDEVGWEGMVP